jgi:hypothetical protein
LALEDFFLLILAGSLTPEQEVGLLLGLYSQALLRWGFKRPTDYLEGSGL